MNEKKRSWKCFSDYTFMCLLGLLYSIYEKTFCEARVNLEVCSYLADEPSLANGPPINRA